MRKKIFFLFCCLGLFCWGYLESAVISSPKGNVYYKAQSGGWVKIEKERVSVSEGYEVTTERASSVEIIFDDGSRVKLGPNSYYKLEKEDSLGISAMLFVGRIRNWVKKYSKEYTIKTPHAVCGVRGTDFGVLVDATSSRVEVYEGSVSVFDFKNRSFMLNKGNMIEVKGEGIGYPVPLKNPPPNLETSSPDRRSMFQKEIYSEISKDEVIKRAQTEIQSAEYQSRKTAIDAYGYRVRLEEYITRPSSNQFKYVVLNTREKRFDFGKILFTFNTALPKDLTSVTSTMNEYYGRSAPSIYLTEINSIISNTVDKVTEEGSGGRMIPDDPVNPTKWTHFFQNYSFYAAGKNEGNENGGRGRMLWSFNDLNNNGKYDSNEFSYWAGQKPSSYISYPMGENVFHSVQRDDYADGTWIRVDDFVLFDNGKIVSSSDLSVKANEEKSSVIDRLNFERVYNSSMFSDKIDIVFSAKLLKDVGIINVK
ncbi:MAG: FecR family protein [Elusimicrobiales bacterium]